MYSFSLCIDVKNGNGGHQAPCRCMQTMYREVPYSCFFSPTRVSLDGSVLRNRPYAHHSQPASRPHPGERSTRSWRGLGNYAQRHTGPCCRPECRRRKHARRDDRVKQFVPACFASPHARHVAFHILEKGLFCEAPYHSLLDHVHAARISKLDINSVEYRDY